MLDVMVDQRVEDVRLWNYPYEFGIMNGVLAWRTSFVWGKKWDWVPMEEPVPKHRNQLELLRCVSQTRCSEPMPVERPCQCVLWAYSVWRRPFQWTRGST